MIESPVLQNLLKECEVTGRHQAIIDFLEGRFGSVPAETVQAIQSITDTEQLHRLCKVAGQCNNLEAFAAQIVAPPSECLSDVPFLR